MKQRKSYEGVWNIIRFNYHFYLLAIAALIILGCLSIFLTSDYSIFAVLILISTLITTLNSLLVSFYIYDISDLYKLNWLDKIDKTSILNKKIINIHAGFDETSHLLAEKFPTAQLSVFDFYDAEKHTEISIKRARKVYAPYPKTKSIQTTNLSISDKSIDTIFLFLAAHEIRNSDERTQFFKELKRICKKTGQIILVEHLRDIPNFLAYTIGFLHFFSSDSWLKNFQEADLSLINRFKITPFITVFILKI
ncbi:methylase involved in ubiquinone/menaquinone biosynthesis [Bernardetia litoralis DSM 6794]|uniref:Methylase involved in ubiquinone/menaquinone biosynthesis n=1 Tax=Bernardetia litoralis (strain ATCC 23117 / DSM 6794 / NBRC 15988 / NCIMB 1366 / Fx l1 / Sio-4) TaxID=880071 RepID=I4AM52_BERLS|nr:class I SAM-dependent methyltransferase [Bernardetia litoralis]AFM05037.1 methylase involved in ubiquinone/menaquinone biosynthesis [Bernardetia litoralis DSM 6794]